MKKLVFMLTALSIVSCGKSKKDNDETPSKHSLEVKAFEDNYNKWQTIKPNYRTYSYSYLVISDAKKWDYVTYVDVVDNAVACRSVKTKGVLSWREGADQINIHEAPKAYLLDDVYKNCLSLKDNPNVKFFYQDIGNDSILRGCNLGCLEKDCTLNDVAIYKISLTETYCRAE
jgi:hypothetical protein